MPKGFPGSHKPDTLAKIDKDANEIAKRLVAEIKLQTGIDTSVREIISKSIKSAKVQTMIMEDYHLRK